MTPNRGAQFIVGDDVLGSTRDDTTNTITLQLGDVVDSDAVSQDAMLVQQPGLCSRPSAATAGRKAAQAYGIRQGDRDVVLGVRDSRSAAIYGGLGEGETCVYADAGQARVVLKDDGSATIYTTDDNTSSGQSCTFQFSATGVVMVWPWGSIEFSEANGLIVNHPSSGASMALGPVSGMPAPFDVVGSTFSVSAALFEAKSPLAKIGTGAFINAAGGSLVGPLATSAVGVGGVFIGTG